jgi:4-diphosphocytidyl-2-C-methyl-D-erythritol kinase
MVMLAPAKLNLMLHVTGRRSDGYHTLQTVFQLLDLGDTLAFDTHQSQGISVEMEGLALPLAQNLVYRAANLLPRQPHQGVHIRVTKRIPDGGGMGGGSSDAATTLVMLNTLWQCGLSRAQLLRLALSLGADVPVFVGGHSAWADGIGEQLQPMTLPTRWFLIVKPAVHVSTADIFSDPELTRDTPASTMCAFFKGYSRNDCEPVVRRRYAEIDAVLRWLSARGRARLTGTGACAFLECDSEEAARQHGRAVPKEWQCWVARGINESPLYRHLPAQ